MPVVPLVNGRLNARSWKTKKIAIVTTTKVCRRVRRATRPTGIASSPATSPATGISANTAQPAGTCQSCSVRATV